MAVVLLALNLTRQATAADHMAPSDPAQSFAVKRAQVEFHNFASLGEPERALRIYGEENRRRGGLLA